MVKKKCISCDSESMGGNFCVKCMKNIIEEYLDEYEYRTYLERSKW